MFIILSLTDDYIDTWLVRLTVTASGYGNTAYTDDKIKKEKALNRQSTFEFQLSVVCYLIKSKMLELNYLKNVLA